ncbi:hypothetical protein NTE_00537 [Candidatus Nitrososphaera evergladensis SR1]|uniref:Uncharacterized protein n=1 Tax=Candidatus Nitrososphaera evergladensis SR1 TaxID=1459636 RepID=A0A075MMX1_9ARCH|nr:hypothetical protein NTE_00537 [Candidatus Nitrososphaera evergladensis SR1]
MMYLLDRIRKSTEKVKSDVCEIDVLEFSEGVMTR